MIKAHEQQLELRLPRIGTIRKGSQMTHGARPQARADYRIGLAALNDEQDALFGPEYDARQEEVKAALATAQGKAN